MRTAIAIHANKEIWPTPTLWASVRKKGGQPAALLPI